MRPPNLAEESGGVFYWRFSALSHENEGAGMATHYKRRNWDTFSEEGANRLAATIRGYWAKRGRADVKVRVEEHVFRADAAHRASIFVVRSNLINGLPPVASAVLAA